MDLLGQQVKLFSDIDQKSKKVQWNLNDSKGDKVSPGLYFYVFKSGNRTATGKILVE